MFKKILENRIIILYLLPLFLGLLTVLSFQPYNFSYINFIIFPIFFHLLIYIKKKSSNVYRKKPFKRYLFLVGSLFGFGFYLGGVSWISQSLTFDNNFKFLIPLSIFFIPLFLCLFTGFTTLIVGPFLSLNFSSLLILWCIIFVRLHKGKN